MAARSGAGAAAAASATDLVSASEFESGNSGEEENGDDGDDALEQGRSGGSPSQALWPDPNGDKEVAGTEPRGVSETRTWEWQPTQERLNLSNEQEQQRRERHGKKLAEVGFHNVPHGEEGPKPLGNCGFGFFSFGESAKNGQKKADEWNQMKKAPVNIMAVTEATDDLQEFLESPSVKLPHHEQESIKHRKDKVWITMKGQETSGSPLLAVDDRSGGRLELVWWEKKPEGKQQGKKTLQQGPDLQGDVGKKRGWPRVLVQCHGDPRAQHAGTRARRG